MMWRMNVCALFERKRRSSLDAMHLCGLYPYVSTWVAARSSWCQLEVGFQHGILCIHFHWPQASALERVAVALPTVHLAPHDLAGLMDHSRRFAFQRWCHFIACSWLIKEPPHMRCTIFCCTKIIRSWCRSDPRCSEEGPCVRSKDAPSENENLKERQQNEQDAWFFITWRAGSHLPGSIPENWHQLSLSPGLFPTWSLFLLAGRFQKVVLPDSCGNGKVKTTTITTRVLSQNVNWQSDVCFAGCFFFCETIYARNTSRFVQCFSQKWSCQDLVYISHSGSNVSLNSFNWVRTLTGFSIAETASVLLDQSQQLDFLQHWNSWWKPFWYQTAYQAGLVALARVLPKIHAWNLNHKAISWTLFWSIRRTAVRKQGQVWQSFFFANQTEKTEK